MPSIFNGLPLLSLLFVFILANTQGDGVLGFNMTLLHTQDTYASAVAVTKQNTACTPFANNGTYPNKCYGGVGRRFSFINSVQASRTNVLLIDTGNFLSQSPYEAAGGPQALGEFYSAMGYSILKLGDHDLASPANLADFLSAVPSATIVASNLINQKNDSHLASYVINTFANYTFASGDVVGVCGGVTQSVREKINTPTTPLDSTSEVDALRAAVGKLMNMGVNKIIAAIYDETLIQTVIDEVIGVDILLVHSELYINDPPVVMDDSDGPYPYVYYAPWDQPVLVVAAGSYGKYIGQLDLAFDEYGVLTSWGGNAYVLSSPPYDEDEALKGEVVDYYNSVVSALYTTQLGTAATNISFEAECLFTECTIGDLQADMMRNLTNTSIAIINSGSIGGGWGMGPIMASDVQNVVKYGADFVYVLGTVSGAELWVALENSVSELNTGRFLQISGLRFTWNLAEDIGWRVVDVWHVDSTNGKETRINNQTIYSVTLLDYMAKGGDGYSMFVNNTFIDTGYTLNQAVIMGLSYGPVSAPPTAGERITASAAKRRACLAQDGSMCGGKGQCISGACICTAPGATGVHCDELLQPNSSSDNHTLAIVLGIVLPLVFLLLMIALITALLMWGFMRYRQPKLQLKEPNYQALVWPKDSLEKGLPKKINKKVCAVLEQFLMEQHVVEALSGVIRAMRGAHIDEVSAAMVLVHQSANKGAQLIKTLLKHELLGEDEAVLFREETLGVKAFSVFSRMVGLPYLWSIFAYPIAELERANAALEDNEAHLPRTKSSLSVSEHFPLQSIFSLTNTIEINPRNLEEGQDNSIGRLQLELILQKLLTRITDLSHFPLYLRQVCHMVYEDMQYDHKDYVHRVLCNLIFLRFICPALLVPVNYGLVKDHPHAKTHRTFILIAKVLQNLANKNDFSGKEEFMEAMNDFIHRNLAQVEHFFNRLCEAGSEPKFGEPATSVVPRQFRKKALSVMLHFIQQYQKELQAELNEFPAYEVKTTLEQLKYLTTQDAETDDDDNDNDDDEHNGSSEQDELDTTRTPLP